MTMLDTLEILIEADSRGLETQLRRGSETILKFVNQMNNQEVNWQKILAGSLDAAIISGIASTFAIAISQAVQFQDSLLNVSNNTAGVSSALSGATGNISDALVNLTGKTGESLATTASAYQAFYKQFGDAASAQELTAEAGALAEASNQNLADLMPQLIQLFNQWGITTLPQAQAALTGLVNSASEGKFSLNELISVISQQGPILQGKTNIGDVANQLQELSNVSGLAKSTIVESFNSISTAVGNPLSTMDLVVGDMSKKIAGPDGLITAFQSLSTFIRDAGSVGATWGQQMGLSLSTTKNLGDQSADSFRKAALAADAAKSSWKPFWDVVNANLSVIDRLKNDTAVLLAILTKDFGFPALEKLVNLLDKIDSVVVDIDTKNWPKLMKDLGVGSIGQTANTAEGGLSKLVGTTNPLAASIMNAIWGALSPVLASTPLAGMLGLGSSPPAPAGNQPSSNNTQHGMAPVTIHQNMTVQGSPQTAQITGKSAADALYSAFQGTLSKLF